MMDWVTQILTFGFSILGCFVFSIAFIVFTAKKPHIVGLAFGALELILGVLFSSAWAYALKISGKVDWFLLGLLGYTPVALIFYTMLLVGVACIGVNLWFIVRQKMNVTGGS